MTRYLVAGNLWLLVCLAMILGMETVGTDPTMVAFFGIGAWLKPILYLVLTLMSGLFAIIFFRLMWKTDRKA